MKTCYDKIICSALWILALPAFAYGENMVLVPEGSFLAGPPNSQMEKALPSFYIDRLEVTQEAYEKVAGHNPSFFKGPRRPVEKINWFQAREFCKAIGKRLPTEWEWEKAAKAGTVTEFYWGSGSADNFGWYKGNAEKQTHPVGKRIPNAFGLYDMAGNVWEWTSSDHENGGKVQRGGSWRNGVGSMKSAFRINSLPHYQYHYVGFRCARSLP